MQSTSNKVLHSAADMRSAPGAAEPTFPPGGTASRPALAVKEIVFGQVEEIRRNFGGSPSPLSDDLILLESGLDSLGLAILVTRLEDIFGYDAFADSNISIPPVTLGDFVRLYETAGRARTLAPQPPR